jgi:hypothetical protein
MCKNHPDRVARPRSDGRNSGLCQECLNERSLKGREGLNRKLAIKKIQSAEPDKTSCDKGFDFLVDVLRRQEDRDREIQDLKLALADRDREVADRDRKIQDLQQDLKLALADRDREVADRDRKIQDLQEENRQFRSMAGRELKKADFPAPIWSALIKHSD